MIRKRIVGLVGVIFVVALAVSFYVGNLQTGPDYIFDTNSSIAIKVKDVDQFKQPTHFPEFADDNPVIPENKIHTPQNNQPKQPEPISISSFTDSTNFETLKFFRYLHRQFRQSKNLEAHLKKVLEHLNGQLSAKEAEKMLALYRAYLEGEIELEKEIAQWDPPKTADDVLEMLARTQEFRRKHLGADIADALYGAEVKSREYILRRAVITKDQDLYGVEKENLIAQLNADMWGDEADSMESKPKPYHRYRLKLELYAKDFSEMEADEKKETIDDFRHSFFSEETITQLEQIDAQIVAEKQAEETYFAREALVLNNSKLSAEEKSTAIHALQNDVFKDEADSFRRRESIRQGLEALKKKEKATPGE